MPPFIAPLRRAIREGRKTETRRSRGLEAQNKHPEDWRYDGVNGNGDHLFLDVRAVVAGHDPQESVHVVKSPFGKPGELRYLREPIVKVKLHGVESHWAQYFDDGKPVFELKSAVEWRWKPGTLSQLLLPKVYARTFVRLTVVEPQRVMDMTEAQAVAEAVAVDRGGSYHVVGHEGVWAHATAKGCFETLFDHLNRGKVKKGRGLRVADNPWLWRIVFKLEDAS